MTTLRIGARAAAPRRLVLALALLAAPLACTDAGPDEPEPQLGALAVTVSGLPSVPADVTVTGPGGFSRPVTTTATLTSLTPGSYTVAAGSVTTSTGRFVPSVATPTVSVSAGAVPTAVTVAYAVATGQLNLTIAGVPTGASALVTVTGPGNFTRSLLASQIIGALEPGTYTVAASPITVSGTTYTPNPATQLVAVGAAATATATVTYSSATQQITLALQQVATGLSSPVYLTSPPNDQRLFIVEQPGRIRVVRNGQLLATPYLDIASRVRSGGEEGLLSVAFDPSFATNGFFYVYYTNANSDIAIERFSATPSGDVASTTSTPVLTIPHPGFTNHNGGLLLFGPEDGMLYVGTGDGGGGGDPSRNGQNLGSLLGKLLRIDVRTLPYTIPATNPFVGRAGAREEIWAYGLRNPWRFAFDAVPGAGRTDLFIADVGQNAWEEVNLSAGNVPGLNYGWNTMEGAHCYPAGTTCNVTGLTQPVHEYGRGDGCSVTGGFVYRGLAIPEIAGHYFFSDYCSGWLRSLPAGGGAASRQWIASGLGNVLSFGRDAAGELYVLTSAGRVSRIVRQ